MKFSLPGILFFLMTTITIYSQSSGSAVKFDGVDDYASATLNTGNTNNTMTMEFWFERASAQLGTIYLADLHSISGANISRCVRPFINNGEIGVYAAPNTDSETNAVTQYTGVIPAINIWTHIAVTISGATLRMYVNGKLEITVNLIDSYALVGTEEFYIGTDRAHSSPYANIKADEIRIWSSERTQAEIQANMFKELTGGEANLLAYYKLNNGSGTTLEDSQTAGSYDGTITGGTWIPSGAFLGTKNALDFDASNDYVNCGNGAQVQFNGTQNFTVEAWVKPTAGVWGSVVSKFQHSGTHEGYTLEMLSDRRVAFLYGNDFIDYYSTYSTNQLTLFTWHHIAATYDGSTVKIYIDGHLEASAAWTNGITDSGTPLVIGARMGTTVFGTFFSGSIDEVRVWNSARTEAQLRENMCKTLVGNEGNLKAYYRLDEINGTTAYDYSASGYNGTLTNMDTNNDWVSSNAFNTWIGAENDNWTNSGNWTNGVPTSDQSVGIYEWVLGNVTAISSNPTVGNLVISSTSSPQLNSNLTVNRNLILENNLDLNGNNITLGSSSYLLEGTGKLSGVAGTISTTRNLSNLSSLNVAGFGAVITTAADMGSTTITRGHTVQTGNGHESIKRYYEITPTNNSSLNATLAFNYIDTELNLLTENNFRLYKSIDNGTTWTDQGGTLNAGANNVTKTGISSFSRWTLGDYSLPLALPIPAVLAAIEGSALSYTEGSGEVQITNTITVSDEDDTNLESAVVQITGNYQSTEDELTFVNQNGITGSWNSALGKMTLTGSSSLANYQTALRTVKYQNSSQDPNTNQRTVSFTVNDGNDNSNTLTRNITVEAVNESPILSDMEASLFQYTEGSGAVQITNSLRITDQNTANMQSAAVQMSGNYKSTEDELSFTDQNGITGNWDATTGKITLSGSSTIENYQTALRSIGYKNTSIKPDTSVRTISFTVNDGDNNSNSLTRNIKVISVNSAPVLHAIQEQTVDEDSSLTIILSASDVEGDSISYTAQSDTSAVTLILADTTLTLKGAANWNGSANITVIAADGIDSDTTSFKLTLIPVNDAPVLAPLEDITINEEETKEITITATDIDGDSLSYSAESSDSSVTINMTENKLTLIPEKDWSGTSEITVTVGDTSLSTNTRFTFEVLPVNDAPVLSNIETSVLQYVIKAEGLSITDSLEITDVDNVNLKSAVISFDDKYIKGEDKLIFIAQNGITGKWSLETGTMTLTGEASIADYKSAIINVQYINSYITPTGSIRTVNISVSDSEAVSNSVSRQIIIAGKNAAPVLSNVESEPMKFVKGDEGQLISKTIKVEDADNKYLFEGKVAISEGFINGEDELLFENQTSITGNYDAASGIINFSGQATLEEYQELMRTVKYRNTKGVKATTSTKKIAFAVRDGQLLSNSVYRTIDLVSPLLTPSNLTLQIISNGSVKLTWQNNSDNEDGFIIWKSQGNSNMAVIDSVNANVTEYIDSDLMETKNYTYRVLAFSNSGAVSDTTNDNQNTILIPLNPPTDLSASVDPVGKINITWKDNSSVEDNYFVERSVITNDSFTMISQVDKDTIHYSDVDIIHNTKYFYRVYAVKDTMKSLFSNEVEVIAIVTDVKDDLTGIPKDYKLYTNYPNPFNPSTVIKFDIPKEGKYLIRVFNILGEVVSVLADKEFTAGRYSVIFDASNISSGIYFYQLLGSEKNFVKKMLLVK